MSNEHSKAYEGTFRTKLRTDSDKEKQESSAHASVEEANVYSAGYLFESLAEDIDVDGMLSEFVNSDFDFKILTSWDKTKKN